MSGTDGAGRDVLPTTREDSGSAGWSPVPGRQAEGGSGRLGLLHRCAVLYLTVPLAVWLLSWLDPWVGVPATALLAFALRHALSGSWRPRRPSRAAGAAAAMALLVVFFSPISGLFLVSDWPWPDWDIHRAVLLDMADGGWPTMLHGYLDGEPALLRYYLGWHMVPAAAARLAGASALNWAVPLWTAFGTALAAMLFVRGFSTARAGVLAAGALFFFNSMDGTDALLSRGLAAMAGRPWVRLDYPELLQTLHTTPQHFLPGALGALLLVQLRDHRRFVSVVGVVLVACLFWSSLLTVALVAMACAAVAGRARWAASWQNLAAAALGLLVAAYLANDPMEYMSGWMWGAWWWDDSAPAYMWARLAILFATEFLLLGFLLWRFAPGLARDPLYVACLAVLFCAPMYIVSSSNFNELWARVSVPALALLAWWAVRAVAGRMPEARSHVAGRGRNVARWCVAATLVAGAVPMAAHYAGLQAGVFEYREGGRSLRTDQVALHVRQRSGPPPFGPVLAATLRNRGRTIRRAPRGDRVVRSAWDVHFERANRLVYVNRDCDPEKELDGWLFLETDPPEAHRQLGDPLLKRPRARWRERPNATGGTTLWLRLRRSDHYVEDRGGCLAVADLATDSVNSFRTGHLDHAGQLLWEAEARLR